jgi:SEC-C motif domain protein
LDTPTFCLCGSGIGYDQCCGLFLSGEKYPATAESLMRSRFSAYVLDNMAYIQKTWDSSTRPKEDKLNFGGESIAWKKLEIIERKKGGAADNKGIVEFKAYYSKGGEDHTLHETSRFIKTNGRWYYLDGVVKTVGKVIQQLNEGKNAPCPCGSGKKFKRCCGKS